MSNKHYVIRFIETEMRKAYEEFISEAITSAEYRARKEMLEKLSAKHYKEQKKQQERIAQSKEKRLKKTA
jgi:ribosome-binding ATPase YchF (GTP1/OBG family)